MQAYNTQIELVNKLFRPEMAKVVISYLEDPLEKWAKNNFKICLRNIKGLRELIERISVRDICLYIDDGLGDNFYNNYEEAFYLIRERVLQYCKGCRQERQLEEFNNFKTCESCRYRAKLKRAIKKYKIQLNGFIERFQLAVDHGSNDFYRELNHYNDFNHALVWYKSNIGDYMSKFGVISFDVGIHTYMDNSGPTSRRRISAYALNI